MEKEIIEKTVLCLLPHQDDEFGLYSKIQENIIKNKNVVCVYFTTGTSDGVSSTTRNNESIKVLTRLGIKEKNILFIGEKLNIYDQSLIEHLEKASKELEKIIKTYKCIDYIYTPAWEGGHPDHDALHAISIVVSNRLNLSNRLFQYPLYNGYHAPGPLFRVFKTLPLNGKSISKYISIKNRLKFLKYCLSYPSQLKTWLGLFPFVFVHYLFRGTQLLQPVELKRINSKPHEGYLYYEKRKFASWNYIHKQIEYWLTSNGKNLNN